jgi:hypothetical protein
MTSLAQLIGKKNQQLGHHFQAEGPGGQSGALCFVTVWIQHVLGRIDPHVPWKGPNDKRNPLISFGTLKTIVARIRFWLIVYLRTHT